MLPFHMIPAPLHVRHPFLLTIHCPPLAISLCVHAGMPATPIPSYVYFTTCGHPGVGVSGTGFSLCSFIAPTKVNRAAGITDPFDTLHRPPASALESMPTQPSATVASKELTPDLNPLDATFTKNRGEGLDPPSAPVTSDETLPVPES